MTDQTGSKDGFTAQQLLDARMYALAQARDVQATIGTAGYTAQGLNKTITERAAEFERFLTTGRS